MLLKEVFSSKLYLKATLGKDSISFQEDTIISLLLFPANSNLVQKKFSLNCLINFSRTQESFPC